MYEWMAVSATSRSQQLHSSMFVSSYIYRTKSLYRICGSQNTTNVPLVHWLWNIVKTNHSRATNSFIYPPKLSEGTGAQPSAGGSFRSPCAQVGASPGTFPATKPKNSSAARESRSISSDASGCSGYSVDSNLSWEDLEAEYERRNNDEKLDWSAQVITFFFKHEG